jgi:hypothetical protein
LVTCDPTVGLQRNSQSYQVFNANCFAAPSPGQNGTYRLPYIKGPLNQSSNISLFKDFAMGESRKLQLRFEAFNFLNHPNWYFLQYDSALYMGYDAFGAAPVNASTAGVMTNKTGHRVVQIAAKFYF